MLKPYGNPTVYNYSDFKIEYNDVNELVQGGPETGYLQIDNFQFPEIRFGTSLIFKEMCLITSVYKWSWGLFLKGNFKPCVINLTTKQLYMFGNPEILFLPKEVKGNLLYYYTDLKNYLLKSLKLPDSAGVFGE